MYTLQTLTLKSKWDKSFSSTGIMFWLRKTSILYSLCRKDKFFAEYTLQLHKKVLKMVVKYLRSPMEYGYKQIVYQTITLIQEATASEIQ